MKQLFSLLLILFTFTWNGFSQDDLANYQRAKTLIGYGNYSEGMDLMRPYLDESKYGRLSWYAAYHFSNAAFQNKQLTLAKSVLEPISSKSQWDKSDEVKYLLSLIYFEEGNPLLALQEIEKIKSETIKKEAERASFKYLQNASVSFLIANLSKFGKNAGYALALKEQLERQTVMTSDERNILGQLQKNPEIKSNTVNKNRNTLDIAVVLPFNYSGGSSLSSLRNGNFVFEIYQGLLFGFEEIRRNYPGKINLKTYDTRRDLNRLEGILQDPFLSQADIIIGPLYPDESDRVAIFAENNGIPFINPLSNVDEKISSMEQAFLFRPSVSALADKVVSHLTSMGRDVQYGLVYSGSTRDELLVADILKKANEKGLKPAKTRKIRQREVVDFFDDLYINVDSLVTVDFMLVISDDPNVASATIGYLESKNVSIPFMVLDSWLNFNFANYEMLTNQEIWFLGNNTIDFSKSELGQFRNDFYQQYLQYPSFNAHLGYEMIHWVYETINPNRGFDWRKNLDQSGFKEGRITYGFDFRGQNHNRFVPVLMFENGKLERR